ncbi:MAG: RNA polymerase sigma factor [Tannerellaceae bacterium]
MMNADTFKKRLLPFHRKLYCIAFHYLEREDEAEDMVQEVYLKLWERKEDLEAIANIEAFAVKMIRNLCLDRIKSASFQTGRNELSSMHERASADLSESYETTDDLLHVKQLIHQLPEQQKQVMQLRHLKECSVEEIEHITGLSAVNIRVLLSRARKKVQEQFKKLNCYEPQ